MKYILLTISIIIFSTIVYLQSKEELSKNSIETQALNNNHKESIKVNSESTKIVNIKENVQPCEESKKIKKIPYDNELSLDSNYDPDYHKVIQKTLSEEDFENFEKDSEVVDLAEMDQLELVVSYGDEDENISTENLADSKYDANYKKVVTKELTAEDFEDSEKDMLIIQDNKKFIKYDDDKFFNKLFSEE